MKKILRIVYKILLIILLIVLLFLSISTIVHKIKLNEEYNFLKDNNYINLLDAGNYKLNVTRYGNKNSKYKIIGLSGLGVNNYSVEMKNTIENLDYDFIFIDRAGYGYSNDTKKEQTVEQVVEDYRNVLKNLNIEGPYILMPHSLGGVYATYWESMYPEEIEGVIMIDTTELSDDVDFGDEYKVGIKDYLELYLSKFGLGRLVLHKYFYKLPSNYSKKDNQITDALNLKNITSLAKISEQKLIIENSIKAYKNINKNDIPKIYICANKGFRNKDEFKEYYEWVRNRQNELNLKVFEIDDESIDNIIKMYEDFRNKYIIPYVEKLGNTKLIYLPGDHYIFEQKPKELSNIIVDFIEKLEGE